MRRRFLPISSVLCLFLCGAVLALWVRSYRQIDYVLWKTADNRDSIGSAYGRIAFKSIRGFPVGNAGVKTETVVQPTWADYAGPQLNQNVGGFAWLKSDSLGMNNHRNVYVRIATVPDWFLLTGLVAILVLSAVRRSRRKRLSPEDA